MSVDTTETQALLERDRHVSAIMSDLQMLAYGVPMSAEHLVSRWIGVRALRPEHLTAARRWVARQFHPDRQGGNARLMAVANAAIDRTITELENLRQVDRAASQTTKEPAIK